MSGFTDSGFTGGGSSSDALGRSVLDFGAKGDGVTDDTAAIQAAIDAANAAGGGVVYVPVSSQPYILTNYINFKSGVSLIGIGWPTIKMTVTPRPIRMSSIIKARVEGIIFDGNAANVSSGNIATIQNCTDCAIVRCFFTNPKSGIALTGTTNSCTVEENYISDCTGTSISLDGSVYENDIVRNEIYNGSGFGVQLTNGAYRNFIAENRTSLNGIELVGLTYTTYENRVIGNHAEGCGDNGISISGKRNLVVGNICILNSYHGIELFGDYNTCTGNNCWNNGQVASSGYAGIATYPGFGGMGSYNTIVGNVTGDNQTVKTQEHAIRLYNTQYSAWANGQTITLNGIANFKQYGLNLYVALNTGTTATGSEPVHTSGTVTGADGIQWQHLATTTTQINFNSAYNTVLGNVNSGNAVSSINYGSTVVFNSVYDNDRLRIPAYAFTGAFPYVENITGDGNPEGVETATNGSMFARRGGTPGITHYIMANASASSRQNTGWKPLALRDSGSTAVRPSLGSGVLAYTYYNSDAGTRQYQIWNSAAWDTIKTIRSEAITSAGALTAELTRHTLSNASGATYAVTLAAPTSVIVGIDKDISMIAGDATNTVTLALTNVIGGSASTTCTFNSASDHLVLRAIQTGASTYAWLVIKEHGVVMT